MYSVLWRCLLLAWALWLAGCSSTPVYQPASPPAGRGNWQAVGDVLRLQGQPYRYGGDSPERGFDCSGLIWYVYAKQGVRLPRSALAMAQELPAVAGGPPQPGDLLFFNADGGPFSHVGLYVGESAFVHAPGNGKPVMRSSLLQPYWSQRLAGVRRPYAGRQSSF